MPRLDYKTWYDQNFTLWRQTRGGVENFVIVGLPHGRGWFEKEFTTEQAARDWMKAQYLEYVRTYASRTWITI